MTDAPALDDLPDPTDRTAPWHGDVPAYTAWWSALIRREHVMYLAVDTYDLIRNYAQAVPDTSALEVLAELGPILEIGAGSGYWARLLQDRGVDVLPVDLPQRHRDSWGRGADPWTDVAHGDHRAVAEHPERTPFVCWPPRPNGFMPELLRIAPQRTLALLTDGPATLPRSPDPLYTALERGGWRRARRVNVPTWPGQFDHLAIWRR